jgi:hypothetical protein
LPASTTESHLVAVATAWRSGVTTEYEDAPNTLPTTNNVIIMAKLSRKVFIKIVYCGSRLGRKQIGRFASAPYHRLPEWQHIGNQIDTAFIFARANFVNVDRRLHWRWTFNHFFIAVWSAKDAHSAKYENIN